MEKIFENNRKWVAEKLSLDPEYFKKIASVHQPEILYIGCSDSRVPVNLFTGTGPGEVFVHRNIANMVVATDLSLLSVLQYAVEYLGVKHIVVCGHYKCGGVLAAMGGGKHGVIDYWLNNIKDVIRLHEDKLAQVTDEKAKSELLIDLNTIEQVRNLSKTIIVQDALREGKIQLHAWVYELEQGTIKDLNWSDELYSDLASIYDLKVEAL